MSNGDFKTKKIVFYYLEPLSLAPGISWQQLNQIVPRRTSFYFLCFLYLYCALNDTSKSTEFLKKFNVY